jgi:hypothetical protein
MGFISTVSGQTGYDVVFMVYGNLDNIVALYRENDITDMNYIPDSPIVITYNDELKKISGYTYATQGIPNATGTGDYDSGDYDPIDYSV